MSADNWSICPKCVVREKTVVEELKKKAELSYGKVTPAEFLSLTNKALGRERGKNQEKTLREDYKIGMDGYGSFEINYSASCDKCDFKYQYNYVIDIPLEGKDGTKT